MRILGVNDGHDGALTLLVDGRLEVHVEAEKDSGPRCGPLTDATVGRLTRFVGRHAEPLDLMAVRGRQTPGPVQHWVTPDVPVHYCNSEEAHLWAAYGLSPYPHAAPCHVLVWAGSSGRFCTVGSDLSVRWHPEVLSAPGDRYAFLYALADPDSAPGPYRPDHGHPGKLMALSGCAPRRAPTARERTVTEALLSVPRDRLDVAEPLWSAYRGIGVQAPEFTALVARFSDRLFRVFQEAARRLDPGLPLLVAGGCGLNCEWNQRWLDSRGFRDVWVPPCCNDSGASLGAAVDAQRRHTGQAKVTWTVDAGEPFVWDEPFRADRWTEQPYRPELLAGELAEGAVVAWVDGRYEIGPRALGHRSLLAEPFRPESRDRLNRIKRRESYRPIAPICLESELPGCFRPARSSPYMLFFHQVIEPRLAAVTHVDGSARVQTVPDDAESRMAGLLRAVRRRCGLGVLCNTSLNQLGRGFLNRASDLQVYLDDRGVDLAVVDGRLFRRRSG